MKFRLRRTSYRQFEKCQYGLSVALRTQAKPTQTLALFRDVLRQVAPSMPIKTIRTMDQQIAESLSTERLTAYLSVFFAALALLLVAVGCTGFWLIRLLGVPARSAFAGVGASSKLIASLLYPVKPSDPAFLVASVAALAIVCAAAPWIPARRAAGFDPMVALREE